MKKIILALAALALMAGNAMAFSLGSYVGPVEIKYSNWESLVTPSSPNLSGIIKITSIEIPGGSALWSQNAGEEITGVFDGFLLSSITTTATSNTLAFTGGQARFWYDTTPDFSSVSPGSGVIDGTPFMTINYAGGILNSDPTITLLSTIYNLSYTSFAFGTGSGYANVVAGSGIAAALFDSNTQNGGTDFFMDSTIHAEGPYDGWPVKSNDPATGAVVPEPGTIALFGAGLVGLIFLKRRRG